LLAAARARVVDRAGQLGAQSAGRDHEQNRERTRCEWHVRRNCTVIRS
jgi:hypothetical protein